MAIEMGMGMGMGMEMENGNRNGRVGQIGRKADDRSPVNQSVRRTPSRCGCLLPVTFI